MKKDAVQDLKKIIAANIRREREKQKFTKADMAKKLKIRWPTYHALETGEVEPRISTLVTVSRVLKEPWTTLVKGVE